MRRIRGLILVNLILFFLVGLAQAQPDLTFAEADAAKWKGANGKTYYVSVSNTVFEEGNPDKPQVSIGYINSHGRRILLTGYMSGEGRTAALEFKPASIEELDDKGGLDTQTLRKVLAKEEFVIKGQATFQDDKIQLILVGPEVKLWKTKSGDVARFEVFRQGGRTQVIALTPEADNYKIARVALDYSAFKTRQEDTLKTLKEQLTPLQGQKSEFEQKLQAAEQESERLDKEVKELESQLKTLGSNRSTLSASLKTINARVRANNAETHKRLLSLNKQFDALIEQQRTSSARGLQSNIAQTGKRRDEARAQLSSAFQQTQGPSLQARLKALDSEESTLNKKLLEQTSSYLAQRIEVQSLGNQFEDLEAQVLEKEREISKLEATPAVLSIEAFAGPDLEGPRVFQATIDMDEEFLGTLLEEQDTAKRMVGLLESDNTRLKEQFPVAKENYDQFFPEWEKAAKEMVDASNQVSEMIWDNALLKAGIETGLLLVDVGVAGATGGISGVVQELVMKGVDVVKLTAEGKTAFDSYNEKELSMQFEKMYEQVRGSTKFNYEANAQQAGSTAQKREGGGMSADSTAKRFRDSQVDKQTRFIDSGLRFGAEVANLHALKKNLLEVSATDKPTMDRIKNLRRHIKNSKVGLKDVRGRISELKAKTNSLTNEALSSKSHSVRSAAHRQLQKAKTEHARLAELEKNIKGQISRFDAGAKAQSPARAADVLKQIGDSKLAIKNMGKTFAFGLLADATKAFALERIDDAERQVWATFFEKQITFRFLNEKTQEAAVQYWRIQDQIDLNKQFLNTEKEMLVELEEIRTAYLGSIEDSELFIKQSDSIDPEMFNKLTVRVTLAGDDTPMKLRLAADSVEDRSYMRPVAQPDDNVLTFTLRGLNEIQEAKEVPLLVRFE